MNPDLKEQRLLEQIGGCSSVLVAFSGGVDSSYLAFMAHRTLGRRAHAVTALSPSVSRLQRRMAEDFARTHGLNHSWIETREMEDSRYSSNPSNRCYFCKTELYRRLEDLRRQWDLEVVLDGSNLDDDSDYRPGRQAVAEQGVRSPLAEAGLTKQEIRHLSRKWGLAGWDKPAMPCLASRFPYGTPVTEQALRQVDQAEDYLRSLGLRNFRVRHHDRLARLEVAVEEMPSILEVGILNAIHEHLRGLGYLQVALDMKGFRSGSLNEALREFHAETQRREEEWEEGSLEKSSSQLTTGN